MSLKEHLPRGIDRVYPERTLRRIKATLGKTAIKHQEILGAPQGKHSRTYESGPRPDVGETARNAGFNTLSEIPQLPVQDEHKIAAPDLIKRIKQPETPLAKEPSDPEKTIPLFTQPGIPAPKGPNYPYKFKD